MTLEIASLEEAFTADVALVMQCTVGRRVLVVLRVKANVLVEIARIAECTKTVSAF